MKFIFFYKLKFKYYLKPYIWSLKKELQGDSIIEIQLIKGFPIRLTFQPQP